ncbi:DUF4271 domain-containing protein [Capnocytophaga sp. ARDL2]|uniref:DUF4271 domain-containing protein n=1 Tax=Capnocytophaga sp. ARDL2 TaxID=3238809 RepID=UPI00355630C4
MELNFITRNYIQNDWALLIFITAIGIIAYNRRVFAVQFDEFSKLLYSNKYIMLYRESSELKTWFTISMTFVQFVTISFLLHTLWSSYIGYGMQDFMQYLQMLNAIIFIVLSKYLIEKMVAVCFELEHFIEQFNLVKVSYRNYLSMILLPFAMILFYNQTIDERVLYSIIALMLLINIGLYAYIIKTYQKQIGGYLYYFILYLCTFEIAPYFILYKWYVNMGI